MVEMNSEFTPQEKQRINELLVLFREHAGSTPEQLRALGVTDEDMELFARVVELTSKAWENFTGAVTSANGKLWEAFTEAQAKVDALGLNLGEKERAEGDNQKIREPFCEYPECPLHRESSPVAEIVMRNLRTGETRRILRKQCATQLRGRPPVKIWLCEDCSASPDVEDRLMAALAEKGQKS